MDIDNWFNLTIRNLQEEVRSAAFEIQSKFANQDYHIRYDRQALYRMDEIPAPLFIWGDWIHIDVPGCRTFNMESKFHVYQKESQRTNELEHELVTFIFSSKLEHKFRLELDEGKRNYQTTISMFKQQDAHAFYNGT